MACCGITAVGAGSGATPATDQERLQATLRHYLLGRAIDRQNNLGYEYNCLEFGPPTRGMETVAAGGVVLGGFRRQIQTEQP